MADSTVLSPSGFTLRSPGTTEHELVVTAEGKTMVYRLSFGQVRLGAVQFTNALSMFPMREN